MELTPKLAQLAILATDPAAGEHESATVAMTACRLIRKMVRGGEAPSRGPARDTLRLHVTNVAFFVLAKQRRGQRLVEAKHVVLGETMELTFEQGAGG